MGGSDVNAGAKEGKGDEGSRESLLGLGGRGWLRSCSGGGEALRRGVLVLGTGAMSPKKGDLALAYPVLGEARGAAGGPGP